MRVARQCTFKVAFSSLSLSLPKAGDPRGHRAVPARGPQRAARAPPRISARFSRCCDAHFKQIRSSARRLNLLL